jgi:hypothetical protein
MWTIRVLSLGFSRGGGLCLGVSTYLIEVFQRERR